MNKNLFISSCEYFSKLIQNNDIIRLLQKNRVEKTNRLYVLDKHNNYLYSFEYHIIAVINKISSSCDTFNWKWAWSVSSIDKKYTRISKDILFYVLSLENDQDTLGLKKVFVNSTFKIREEQLFIMYAFVMYLTKKKYFHVQLDSDDNITFYILTDKVKLK